MSRHLCTPLLALVVLSAALPGCFGAVQPITRRSGPFQPSDSSYTYANGTVYQNGQAVMQVAETDVDRLTTHYAVSAVDGSPLASVTFSSSYDNSLECRAEFPTLGVHYEARHPIISFTELLSSYIDNGVLVGARVDPDGLARYTQSRGIALIDTAAQQQRLAAAGAAAMCRDCEEDFRRCQVDASYRRAHPSPGVTVSESCEHQFQGCSQGGILTRPDEWPCGAPPR